MPESRLLPVIDDEPDEWGPDHDELVGELLDEATIAQLVREGERQRLLVNPDDDRDNGL